MRYGESYKRRMTLYVHNQFHKNEVLTDLKRIARWAENRIDVSMDLSPTPRTLYDVVNYTAPGTGGQSGDETTRARVRIVSLLDQLVNGGLMYQVVIVGSSSNDLDTEGRPIRGSGATSQAPPPDYGDVRIQYDVEQCSGQGACAVASDGTPLPAPGPVLLYHEMWHAFELARSTVPHGTEDSDPEWEPRAITNENDLRSLMGLTARSQADYHGRACGCQHTGPLDPVPGSRCFVVSAAMGDEASSHVDRLRRVRDGLLRETTLGRTFFDALYREYYRFSPAMAADIAADAALRVAVRAHLVEPLIEYLELVEAYCRHNASLPAAASSVIAARRARLAALGVDAATAAAMSAGLRGLATAAPETHRRSALTPLIDGPLPLLAYLHERIGAAAGSLDLAAWAIAEPLADYWSVLAEVLAAKSGDDRLPASLRRIEMAILTWFSRMPVPERVAAMTTTSLDADLVRLATGALAPPAVRRLISARIRAARSQRAGVPASCGCASVR